MFLKFIQEYDFLLQVNDLNLNPFVKYFHLVDKGQRVMVFNVRLKIELFLLFQNL